MCMYACTYSHTHTHTHTQGLTGSAWPSCQGCSYHSTNSRPTVRAAPQHPTGFHVRLHASKYVFTLGIIHVCMYRYIIYTFTYTYAWVNTHIHLPETIPSSWRVNMCCRACPNPWNKVSTCVACLCTWIRLVECCFFLRCETMFVLEDTLNATEMASPAGRGWLQTICVYAKTFTCTYYSSQMFR